MTQWPCIYCTTEECREKHTPIPLPFAMPESSTSNPEAWPNDSNWLYVACPVCRRVSQHSGFYPAQLDRSIPESNSIWLRVSYRCAVGGCKLPVEFHVLTGPTITQTTVPELREKLNTEYWKGAFPCAHPIATTSEQEVRFDRPTGILRGYNPNNPRWNEIE